MHRPVPALPAYAYQKAVSLVLARNAPGRVFDPAAARAAKQALAERLAAIGSSYVPEGWRVTWRKNLTGCCYHGQQRLAAPRPVTRNALYVFPHECAHAHLHDDAAGRRKPVHVREHEAEQWAHARMREHNIPVPRRLTKRAKDNVARKIARAQAGGAAIDAVAARFADTKKNGELEQMIPLAEGPIS